MENAKNPIIHTFTFNTPGHTSNEITVTTPNYAIMCKFIDTHFDKNAYEFIISKPLEELPDDIVEQLESSNLEYYIIADNTTKNRYSIPTSFELLEVIGNILCSELSMVEVFGDTITRTEELPIMKALVELIDALELGNVLDLELKDSDEANPYVMYNKINRYEFDEDGKIEDEDSYDDTVIYSQMRCGLMTTKNKEPLPFTINGYVSAFSSLLVKP